MRDVKKLTKLMKEVLVELGVNFEEGDVKRTPKRVAKTLLELTSSYQKKQPKVRLFPAEHKQVILIKNLEFASLCEHHLLPFVGHVSIAYVPDKWIVGLSKPARIVEYLSHKLMIQERFTKEIAHALWYSVKPEALGVKVVAQHLCSKIRGVKSADQEVVTYEYWGFLNWKHEIMERLRQEG